MAMITLKISTLTKPTANYDYCRKNMDCWNTNKDSDFSRERWTLKTKKTNFWHNKIIWQPLTCLPFVVIVVPDKTYTFCTGYPHFETRTLEWNLWQIGWWGEIQPNEIKLVYFKRVKRPDEEKQQAPLGMTTSTREAITTSNRSARSTTIQTTDHSPPWIWNLYFSFNGRQKL